MKLLFYRNTVNSYSIVHKHTFSTQMSLLMKCSNKLSHHANKYCSKCKNMRADKSTDMNK